MAKIPLTIDKNYCASWGVWHGLRELIQNAKDAEDYEGKRMDITHFPKTNRLEIVTRNAYVEPANLLVLGRTSKSDGLQRGKFGEGFVLGVLALVRRGCDVKLRNGDTSWTVAFESPDVGHPLEGHELLTFKSRALQIREPDFCIEVDGINAEAWGLVQQKILFLNPPNPENVIKTSNGSLLLEPSRKGHVYVRGLYVREFSDLACGYDIENIQLDRDRQMVNEWDLHYALGAMWQAATIVAPEIAAPKVYEMARDDHADARGVKWHADVELLASVRKQFEEENGEDAIPVTNNHEAREVTKVGGKPKVVNTVLKELLEKSGVSLETSKKRLEGTVEKRWSPDEIQGDAYAYGNMCRLEAIVPCLVVVTFRGEAPGCHLIDESTNVGVDRRLLDQPYKDLLQAVLPIEAQRLSVTAYDVLFAHMVGESLESKRDQAPTPSY